MQISRAVILALGMQAVALASVTLPPPTVWKGIDYSPRRHSYFRMLYDWNTHDPTTGQVVSAMADIDLATLSQNGFNLVHLYLWDQLELTKANPGELAGFITAPGDPSQSPNNQWSNLNDFVTRAENHGLFVALHFASGYILDNVNTVAATKYATWVGQFIQYLNCNQPSSKHPALGHGVQP